MRRGRRRRTQRGTKEAPVVVIETTSAVRDDSEILGYYRRTLYRARGRATAINGRSAVDENDAREGR